MANGGFTKLGQGIAEAFEKRRQSRQSEEILDFVESSVAERITKAAQDAPDEKGRQRATERLQSFTNFFDKIRKANLDVKDTLNVIQTVQPGIFQDIGQKIRNKVRETKAVEKARLSPELQNLRAEQTAKQTLARRFAEIETQPEFDELEIEKFRTKEQIKIDNELEKASKLDEQEFSSQKERFQRAGDLRTDFRKASKDFADIRDAFAKVEAAASDPTSPAANLSMVFNFMKILDPGSTVREGEQATARNAAGVPDRVKNAYNAMLEGVSLTPEQVKDFEKQARSIFSSQVKIHEKRVGAFTRASERAGVDPKDVILELTVPEEFQSPNKIGRFEVEVSDG